MPASKKTPPSLTQSDPERSFEFEFVRACENAALNSIHWLGRGDKESADAAACDAINGCFDLIDMCGEVVIGEGQKDNAPGIFLGDRLGNWRKGAPKFAIALDPIDGTTNISKGMPNSISVMAAVYVPPGGGAGLVNIPTFYSEKLAYGPQVAEMMRKEKFFRFDLDTPTEEIIEKTARMLGKNVKQVVTVVLDRPRHEKTIQAIRGMGASLRLIADGDITAAIAPSLPDSGVDLYMGIGGSPEGVLTAAALRTLGGDLQLRMWVRDEEERTRIAGDPQAKNLRHIYHADELAFGPSALFCVTGISDNPLTKGVKFVGRRAITHTLLMRARSRTVRYIKAYHDLDKKTIHLRSDDGEHLV
ncbi:MAG TPA: fructose-bisphosphatase class II family protein [Opitutaceae bacterium]|nr:fructose-bisphosphatase class II family protein [Opitutaceae bacterium]